MQDVTLTLPMLPDMELTASRTAGAMGERIRMNPDKIEEVQAAVVEATLNAFEHSGALDRQVSLRFSVLGSEGDPEGLQITVQDTGHGISAEDLNRTKVEQKRMMLRKRGHGLRIISGLMDEVDIRSGAEGTTIIMRKMR
ncbi:MAG: ATP-binding protein [bacterium]|nr:ATP-binding protein [bacterium]